MGFAARQRSAWPAHQSEHDARAEHVEQQSCDGCRGCLTVARRGYLSGSDLQAVSDWVMRNEAVLVDYWDFRIDTDELLQRLQPLSPPVLP